MRRDESRSVNPYATPDLPRIPSYWARLLPALRRAFRHYRMQMRAEKVTPLQELRAWLALLFYILLAAATTAVIIAMVLVQLLPLF